MIPSTMSRLEREIDWRHSGDEGQPWEARLEGESLRVRVNDTPKAKFLYSLIVDGKVAEEFDDWPDPWIRPLRNGPDDEASLQVRREAANKDPSQKYEFEREVDKTYRRRGMKPSPRVLRKGEVAIETIKVRNDNDGPMTVLVKPWDEEYPVEPGAVLEVIGRGPRGKFEVSSGSERVVVHAWSGAKVHVLREGKDITKTSSESPAP